MRRLPSAPKVRAARGGRICATILAQLCSCSTSTDDYDGDDDEDDLDGDDDDDDNDDDDIGDDIGDDIEEEEEEEEEDEAEGESAAQDQDHGQDDEPITSQPILGSALLYTVATFVNGNQGRAASSYNVINKTAGLVKDLVGSGQWSGFSDADKVYKRVGERVDEAGEEAITKVLKKADKVKDMVQAHVTTTIEMKNKLLKRINRLMPSQQTYCADTFQSIVDVHSLKQQAQLFRSRAKDASAITRTSRGALVRFLPVTGMPMQTRCLVLFV